MSLFNNSCPFLTIAMAYNFKKTQTLGSKLNHSSLILPLNSNLLYSVRNVETQTAIFFFLWGGDFVS